ncbi:MAG: hypothetical protein F4117_02645 [Acidimicrobiales bacterium]|nr:hypothetical protein [Acidimicrobiales bacterium]MXX44076.1 hypothetical protein [Acidimicrobiales bacterium]MXZ14218.1 hypothetical protein [Acidimicrobiales bacterium]MYA26743.1 hypothetical protein [Acidimicrobiales bacterium]MYA81104.1 hypothetical protein [Acidimicrobiales bacterium]
MAQQLGRRFVLVDSNPEAIEVMQTRLLGDEVAWIDKTGAAIEPETSDRRRESTLI